VFCLFVIGHDRRKILHFNVTRNSDALWIVQQLREAWPYKEPHRFLLFDRDAKFGADVVSAVRDMGSEPIRTAFRSPWQSGVVDLAASKIAAAWSGEVETSMEKSKLWRCLIVHRSRLVC
jgi:hypothetical protein